MPGQLNTSSLVTVCGQMPPGDPRDEDAWQNTVVRLLTNPPQEAIRDPKKYLEKAVMFNQFNEWRAEGRRRRRERQYAVTRGEQRCEEASAPIERAEEFERLKTLIARLNTLIANSSPLDQLCIDTRINPERSEEQLASDLHRSVRTVQRYTKAAIDRLRSGLGEP